MITHLFPTITSPSQCSRSTIISIASHGHLSSLTLVDADETSHDIGPKNDCGGHSEVIDVFADRKLGKTLISTPSNALPPPRIVCDIDYQTKNEIGSPLTADENKHDACKRNDIPDPAPSFLHAFDELMMFSSPFGPTIYPSSACYPTPSEVPTLPSSSSISLVFPSIPSLPQTPVRQSTSRRRSSVQTLSINLWQSMPENVIPATPIKKQRFFSKGYLFSDDGTGVIPPAGPSNLGLPVHRPSALGIESSQQSGESKESQSCRMPTPRLQLSPLCLSLTSFPSLSSLKSLDEDVFYSMNCDVPSPSGEKATKSPYMHLRTFRIPSPGSHRDSRNSLLLDYTDDRLNAQPLLHYSLDLPGVQLRSSSTFSLVSRQVGSGLSSRDSIFNSSGGVPLQEGPDFNISLMTGLGSGNMEAYLKTDDVCLANTVRDSKAGSLTIPQITASRSQYRYPISLSKRKLRELLKRIFNSQSWSQFKPSSISKPTFTPTMARTPTSLSSKKSGSISFPAKLVCEIKPVKKSKSRRSRKQPLELLSGLNKLGEMFKWNNWKETKKDLRDKSTKLNDTPEGIDISKRVKKGLWERSIPWRN